MVVGCYEIDFAVRKTCPASQVLFGGGEGLVEAPGPLPPAAPRVHPPTPPGSSAVPESVLRQWETMHRPPDHIPTSGPQYQRMSGGSSRQRLYFWTHFFSALIYLVLILQFGILQLCSKAFYIGGSYYVGNTHAN